MSAKPLHHLAVVAIIAVASVSPPVDIIAADESMSSPVLAAEPSPAPSPVTAGQPLPDLTADFAGGIAARLHSSGGERLAGDLFVLMATAGSDAPAILFDETPYIHVNGTAADTLESNIDAVEVIEGITGIEVDRLDLTAAPGGGASSGIVYAIAYLNVVSDGAFTGELRVAATGQLGPHGYVDPINAMNEKTAAARLADVDVIFSPSTADDGHIDAHGARRVGELTRARNTGSTLGEERRLDNYRRWGSERPDGMDIVGIRHIADVAAYLCGSGSDDACLILDLVDDSVIGRPPRTGVPRPADTSVVVNAR